jgi:hypothetical protein
VPVSTGEYEEGSWVISPPRFTFFEKYFFGLNPQLVVDTHNIVKKEIKVACKSF